jgi:hypothetical protein
MAEANGWRRRVPNSAKLVNLLSYQPTLAPTERCVDYAVAGRMP